MAARTRQILTFAVTFPPVLLAVLPIYAIVVHPYERAIVSASNGVLSLMQPPMHISISASGGWEFSFEGYGSADFKASIADLTLRSFDLALLPALLIAMPTSLRRRAHSLLVGLPAVFAVHIISAVAVSHVLLGIHFHGSTSINRTMLLLFASGGQFFGAALFLLLTWQFWVTAAGPLPVMTRRGGSSPRNLPCPCQSGVKFKHCCGRVDSVQP